MGKPKAKFDCNVEVEIAIADAVSLFDIADLLDEIGTREIEEYAHNKEKNFGPVSAIDTGTLLEELEDRKIPISKDAVIAELATDNPLDAFNASMKLLRSLENAGFIEIKETNWTQPSI